MALTLSQINVRSNAYWSKMLNDKGVDVLAFDSQLHEGGKILVSGQNKQSSSRNHHDNTKTIDDFMVHRGGPEILDEEKWVKGENHLNKIWLRCLQRNQYSSSYFQRHEKEGTLFMLS